MATGRGYYEMPPQPCPFLSPQYVCSTQVGWLHVLPSLDIFFSLLKGCIGIFLHIFINFRGSLGSNDLQFQHLLPSGNTRPGFIVLGPFVDLFGLRSCRLSPISHQINNLCTRSRWQHYIQGSVIDWLS